MVSDSTRVQVSAGQAAEDVLASRARLGDREAFSEIARLYRPRMYKTALSVVRNPADAEDVVQEALCKAFMHICNYRQEAPLVAWLGRIARNEGLALLRKRHTSGEAISLDDQPYRAATRSAMPGSSMNPEQITDLRETRRLLRDSVHRLKPTYRSVLLLRGFEDFTNSEIAHRLGISETNVKLRIHRARRSLRQVLEPDTGRLSSVLQAGA